jgi:hypothetical protein
MVTSATKDALFVQPGALVGMGVCGVEVALASTEGVSVAVGGASVTVSVGAAVSVMGAVAASVGACAPQAEVSRTTKSKIALNVFFMQTSLDCYAGETI